MRGGTCGKQISQFYQEEMEAESLGPKLSPPVPFLATGGQQSRIALGQASLFFMFSSIYMFVHMWTMAVVNCVRKLLLFSHSVLSDSL